MGADVPSLKRALEHFQEVTGGRLYQVKLTKEAMGRLNLEDSVIVIPEAMRHTPFITVPRRYFRLGDSDDWLRNEDVLVWEPVNVTDLVLEIVENRGKSEIGSVSHSFDVTAAFRKCGTDSSNCNSCPNNCARFAEVEKDLADRASNDKRFEGVVIAPVFRVDISTSHGLTIEELEEIDPLVLLAYLKRNKGVDLKILDDELWQKRDRLQTQELRFIKYDIVVDYSRIAYRPGSFARRKRRNIQDKLTYNRLKYPKRNFVYDLEVKMHGLLEKIVDRNILKYYGGQSTAEHIHNVLRYIESFRRIRRFGYRRLKTWKKFKCDHRIYLSCQVMNEREKKAILKIVA